MDQEAQEEGVAVALVGQDSTKVLSRDPWFAGRKPSLFDSLTRHSVVRAFLAGELIYAAGDPPGPCFAVLSGCVRLSHYTESGRQVLFSIHPPGSWFGELSEFDGLPRFHMATAHTSSKLLVLTHAGLTAVMEEAPEFQNFITLLLCRHLRRALDMLVETKVLSVRERVMQTLASLHLENSQAGPTKLTHSDLSSIVGASRQAISKVLHQLRAEGVIALSYGSIEILDVPALQRMTTCP